MTIIANTGSSITVDLNTTAYATWTSGGTLNTRPQTGEPVKARCLFDIPVRFATAIDIAHISRQHRETSQIDLVELLNPPKTTVADYRTLAVCIRIEAAGGMVVRLTDHLRDLTMSNGDVYQSTSGYEFTGLSSSTSLAPGVIDLQGIVGWPESSAT